MDSGNVNVLPQPSAVMMSCDDVNRPPSSPFLCADQEKEEGHHDNIKPEQKAQTVKKGKPKGKLVRSMAVCEESSPPAPENCTKDSQKLTSSGCHDDDSTFCTKEVLEKSQSPNKNVLSKESSVEYTDSSGVDLQQFISDTLNSNPRDRMALLKLERDMIDFITSNSPYKKFPQMSSYHRMLVHRVAAYFGMEHNVDQTGKAVIINRTVGTRIPEQRFLLQIREDKTEETQQWKAILPRDNNSEDQPILHPLREKQSRSMEEREEDYNRVRERIFKQELRERDGERDEERERVRLWMNVIPMLRPRGRGSSSGRATEALVPAGTAAANRAAPKATICTAMTPGLGVAQSRTRPITGRVAPRNLVSTQSAIPTPVGQAPSLCTGCSLPPPSQRCPPPAVNPAMYNVENAIPPGSILVNPQTGQPFLNPDGTPAVYIPPDSQQLIRSQPHLPAPPLQQPQPQMEDLSSQFANVALSCPSTGEAPPLYIFQPPPPPSNQAPHYCQSSPQVPMYYYPGQYPTSAPQTCRPPSPSQQLHNQAGYPMTLGVQPSHSQAQSMLGNYPSMAAHQCGVSQVPGSVSYAQSGVVAPMGGEGGYCCMGPPPPCAPMPPPAHPGTCQGPSCFSMGGPAWGVQY
ncbi:cAMP-regulated phosphoprotein 21 [Merluccius polli]|uniref:cAMP-regulated phosphoprotein 21 n=1 Tax=Merluccius polli TaxID=89951 RepID=A0AA47MSW4_MERPO|nr:cAMP-regulated phosphoprotein 21 [Merluccius polli]